MSLTPFESESIKKYIKSGSSLVTSNTATEGNSFNYVIQQYIPNNYYGYIINFNKVYPNTFSDPRYKSFNIQDTIDSNLTINGTVTVVDEDGHNASSYFSVSTGSTVTVTANSSALNNQDFYMHVYSITIPVTVKSGAGLTASLGNNEAHSTPSGKEHHISNTSKYIYTREGVSGTQTKNSNVVLTTLYYNVTTSITHGTITQSENNITIHSNKTVTWTPDKGYYIKSVTVNGTSQSISNIKSGSYTCSDIRQNYTINVVCEPISGTISITKQDSTNSNKKLAGATFELQNSDGTKIKTFTDNGGGNYSVSVSYTETKNGSIKIKETKAPADYYITAGDVSIDMTTQNLSSSGTFTYSTTISNTPYTKAKVIVNKTDAITKAKLSGATFEIRQYNNGSYVKIANLSWDSSNQYYYYNYIQYSETNQGRFQLVETTAPNNYYGSVSGDGVGSNGIDGLYTSTFTLEKTSGTSNVIDKTFSATNTPYPKGIIEVTKTDATNGGYLSGATFSVYEYNKNTGTYNTSARETLKYNSSTHKYSSTQLQYSATNLGKFKIVETDAPDNYFGSNNDFNVAGLTAFSQEITIQHTSTNRQTVYTYTLNNGNPVTNLHYPKAQVSITKRDVITHETGAGLSGAVFKIYEWDGSNYTNVIDTLTDNGDGTYISKEIQYTPTNQGKFKILETKAPAYYFGSVDKDDPENKYRLDTTEKVKYIDLKNDNGGGYFKKGLTVTNYPYDIANTPYPNGVIELTKVDATHNDMYLEGATFSVYEWDESKKAYNTTARETLKYDSATHKYRSSTYQYSASNLGKFKVVETDAPDNYFGSNNDFGVADLTQFTREVTIAHPNTNLKTLYTYDLGTQTNLHYPKAQVAITKKDSITGVSDISLSGAIFKIYEWTGSDYTKEIDTLKDNKNGTYISSEIQYTPSNQGKFKVIEEKAPTNYFGSVTNDDPENKFRLDTVEKVKYIDLKNDNNGGYFKKGLIVTNYPYNIANTPYPKGIIELTKVDATNNNLYVDNTTFSVYEWDESKKAYNTYAREILRYDSTTHKYVSSTYQYSASNLGKFKVVETKAATGYFGSNDDFGVAGLTQFTREVTIAHTASNQKTVYTYDLGTQTNLHYPMAQISINKKDSVTNQSGTGLSGAIFKIYEWTGSDYTREIDTFTDNGDGTYISSQIQYSPTNQGKFKVLEVKAPDHYFWSVDEDDPENKYRIDTAEKVKYIDLKNDNGGGYFKKGLTVTRFTYDITNTPYPKALLTLKKTDSITGEVLNQAKFRLYEWNKKSNGWDARDLLTDNGDGTYKTPVIEYSAINVGKFKITEEESPYYYTNSRQEVLFTLTDPGYHEYTYATKNPSTIPNLNLTNEPWKVLIQAIKVDSETLGRIEGATFTVYEYNKNTDKFEEYKINRKGDTITLKFQDDRTYVSSDWLYANRRNEGRFRIVETQAPEGYYGDYSNPATLEKVKNDVVITADNNGNTVEITNGVGIYSNTRVKGTISVDKIDIETRRYLPQGNATLDGAVYGLYAAEDIYHQDTVTGRIYAKDEEVQRQTIVNGKLSYEDVEIGKYYIREITAPTGYLLSSEKYNVTIDYQGEQTAHVYKEATVQEMVKKQAFRLQKFSQNSASTEESPLEGAGFKIFLISDLSFVKNGKVKPDENGNYNPKDFIGYNYDNEQTAMDYSQSSNGTRIAEIFTQTITETVDGQQQQVKGVLVSPLLAYGKYVVIENTVPDNRYIADPVVVTVREDLRDKLQYFYVVDDEFEALIKVNKKDATTQELVLNKTAGYRIWSETENKYMTYQIGYPTVEEVGTLENPFRLTEDGYFMTPVRLQIGDYVLEEVEAPDGYVLSGHEGTIENGQQTATPKSKVKFTISTHVAYYQDSNANQFVISVDQYNTEMLGELKINKKGEFLKGTTTNADGSVTFNYELDNIANAQFEIRAKEDIKTQYNSDVVKYAKDTLIGTITTNANGIGYLDNLPIGKYYIRETQAGFGFTLNKEEKEFEITYQGQETPVQVVEVDYVNERQKVNLNGKAGIKIEKEADKTIYRPGEKITYTIKVTNTTDRVIRNIEVKETLIDGQFEDMHVANVNVVSDKVVIIGQLKASQSIELKFTTSVGALEAGEEKVKIHNEVTAKGTTTIPLPDNPAMGVETEVEDKADENVYVVDESKNMVVTKEALRDSYEPGETAQYVIKVINTGSKDIININVGDIVLDGRFVELDESNINGANVNYAQTEAGQSDYSRVIIDKLVPGQEVVLKYEYKIPENIKIPEAEGKYVLNNIVVGRGTVITPNPGDPQHPIQEETRDQDEADVDVIKNNVRLGIIKKDIKTGEDIQGAEFGLYSLEDITASDGRLLLSKDSLIEKSTTNAQGKALFKADLPLGRYYVKEISAPEYYELSPEKIEINATYRGQDLEIINVNSVISNHKKFEALVKVNKRDSESKEMVLNKTAAYRIWSLDDSKYIEQTSGDTKVGTAENPYRINAEGYLVTPETLKIGRYELREVEAPNGYIQNGYEGKITNGTTTSTKKAAVQFTIGPNESNYEYPEIDVATAIVDQYNEQMLGEIKITKTGEFITGTKAGENGLTTQYGLAGIQSAEFEVYAKEDIKTQYNSDAVKYKKDTLIGTITTNADGIAYLDNLPIGKYYIKEIKAGNGFVLNTEVKDFEITYQGAQTPVQQVGVGYVNERQKVNLNGEAGIKVEKYADKTIYRPGETAIYTIKVTNTSDRVIRNIEVKETLIDGEFEDIHTSNVNKISKKVVVIGQLQAAESVELKFTTTLGQLEDGEDKVKVTNVVQATGTTTVPDPDNPDLTIEKQLTAEAEENVYVVDESKNMVVTKETLRDSYEPGEVAQYVIKVINTGSKDIININVGDALISGRFVELEQSSINGAHVRYVQTGVYGRVIIDKLVPGQEVVLKYEYEIPEDTQIPEAEGKFVLNNTAVGTGTVLTPNPSDPDHPTEEETTDQDDETIDVIENNVELGIIKQDIKTGENLAGAEVGLYALEDIRGRDNSVVIAKDTLIEKATTNAQGKAIFKVDLPLGRYYVQEISAPEYYELSPEKIEIDATYRGQDLKIINVNSLISNHKKFEALLQVNKRDSESEELVLNKNAAYRIWSLDDSKYIEQTSGDTKVGTAENPYRINAEGYLVTPEKLRIGRYELREVEAPDGYIQNGYEGKITNGTTTQTPKPAVQFTIGPDETNYIYPEIDVATAIIDQYNEQMLGEIKITKTGEFITGTTDGENGGVRPQYGLAAIENAEFEVYARENIYTQYNSKVVQYAKDAFIGLIVTNANGIGYLDNLPIGKYYIKETKAGDGFVLNTEVKDFEITYQGAQTPVQQVGVDYVNERQKVNLNGESGIKVEKYADKTIYRPGETATYTIKVTNTSDRVIRNIEVKETLIDGEFEDIHTSNVNKISDKLVIIGQLQAAESVELKFTTTLGQLEDGEDKVKVTNLVQATGTTTVPDPNNPREDIDVEVKGQADEDIYVVDDSKNMVVIKEALRDSYEPGEVAQYAIKVINTGSKDIININVGDALIDGRFVELEQSSINGAHVRYAQSGGQVDYSRVIIEKLIPRQEVVLKYEYQIPEDTQTPNYVLNNTAVGTGTVLTPNPDDPEHPIEEETRDEDDEDIDVVENNVELGIIKQDIKTGENLAGAEVGLYALEDIKGRDNQVIIRKDTLIERATTNAQGKAIFKVDLPLGRYYVKEISAPEYYELSPEKIEIDATYRGQDLKIINVNSLISNHKKFEALLQVNKRDSESKELVLNKNAAYRIWSLDDSKYIEQTSGDTKVGTAENPYRINTEGYLVTPEKLRIGRYELREVAAPDGYIQNGYEGKVENGKVTQTPKPAVQFTISPDETNYIYPEIDVAMAIVDQYNEQMLGEVKITKKGEFISSITERETGGVNPQYKLATIENAEFEVYAKEDIKAQYNSDVIKYKKDTLVGTIITNADGIGYLDNLPIGKYYIKETKAGNGFVLNTEIKDFEITYQGEKTPIQQIEDEYVNERQKINLNGEGGILVEKTIEKKVYRPGETATYTIKVSNTSEKDITNIVVMETIIDGEFAESDSKNVEKVNDTTMMIKKLKPGESETLSFTTTMGELEDGEEKVEVTNVVQATGKTKVPDPNNPNKEIETEVKGQDDEKVYVVNDNKNLVVIKEALRKSYEPGETAQYVIHVINTGDLDIYNLNLHETLIDGRFVEIEEASSHGLKINYAVENGKIDYNTVIIEKLNAGEEAILRYEYDIPTSVVIPEGEELQQNNIVIGKGTVRRPSTENPDDPDKPVDPDAPEQPPVEEEVQDEDNEEIEIRDNGVKLGIIKKDVRTGERLQGAVFGIYASEDIKGRDNKVVIAKDTLIETAITNEQGQAIFTVDLPLGRYYVKEIEAPENYILSEETVEFDGRYRGQDVEIIDIDEVIANRSIDTKIGKVDEEGQTVPGAELEIVDEDGNVIESWTTNKQYNMFERLEKGKMYILREKRPADGYTTAKEIKFYVGEDGKLYQRYEDDEGFLIKDVEIEYVEMVDEKTKIEIEIIDKETKKHVEGIKVEIRDKTTGEEVYTYTTGEEEIDTIEGLPVGDYDIVTRDPSNRGYVTTYGEAKVRDINIVQRYKIEQDYTKVEISLKDEETKELLEGGEIEVVDQDEKVVKTIETSKEAKRYERLPIGRYTLVQSKTREGYYPSKNVKINILDTGEEQKYEMINKKKRCNFSITKRVVAEEKNGERKEINYKLPKLEITAEEVRKTDAWFLYKIEVKNEGEIAGKVAIREEIPSGMQMRAERNPGWNLNGNEATRITDEIQPGESREYEVWLRYDNYLTNLGTKENRVSIVENYNAAGFTDVYEGDNHALASIVIAITTGLGRTGDTIMIVVLSVAILGVISAIVVEIIKNKHSK